jgi:hypothetical protein
LWSTKLTVPYIERYSRTPLRNSQSPSCSFPENSYDQSDNHRTGPGGFARTDSHCRLIQLDQTSLRSEETRAHRTYELVEGLLIHTLRIQIQTLPCNNQQQFTEDFVGIERWICRYSSLHPTSRDMEAVNKHIAPACWTLPKTGCDTLVYQCRSLEAPNINPSIVPHVCQIMTGHYPESKRASDIPTQAPRSRIRRTVKRTGCYPNMDIIHARNTHTPSNPHTTKTTNA